MLTGSAQTTPAVRRTPVASALSRAPLTVFLGLIALSAAAVLSLKDFPTLDGPMLTYYAEAFRSLMAGHSVFHDYYRLQHVAGAHMFYFYFFSVLSAVFHPLAIEKLFVALYIVWLAYALYYLAEGISPRHGLPAVLFVFPFALNTTVYWAFYDFSIGLATALFICGWWLRYSGRLTPVRSALWAAMVLLAIVMHFMTAAVVLLFAGIHLALSLLMEFRGAAGAWALRARSAVRAVFKPAAHVALGGLLLLLFKPASIGNAQTTPFFQHTGQRLFELAAMRPMSPFESRSYRMVLGLALLAAAAMFLAGLWARRRSGIRAAELSASATALAAFAAYVIVPDWTAGGAFIPHRFAVIGTFFVVASAALWAASHRSRLALTAAGAALTLAALAFQYRMDQGFVRRYSAAYDLPPLPGVTLAATISEEGNPDRMWSGVPYVERSGMALLNSPWLDIPGNWLRVREPQSCQYLNPFLMKHCLMDVAESPQRPPLDVLVGVRSAPAGPGETETSILARRYGLTRLIWESPYLSIYARP